MPSCGNLTIEPRFDPGAVTASSCTLQPSPGSTINPGDTVTMYVVIDNGNDVPASVTVTFSVEGQQFGSVTKTVHANGSSEFQASYTPSSMGLSSGNVSHSFNPGNISSSSVDATSDFRSSSESKVAKLRRRTGV